MKKLLAPLSSLKLTVILIIAAMLLVYAGTWAQLDAGAIQVQKKYFHSFYTWVDFATLFPRSPDHRIAGGFPIPGGYTVGLLMLINLLAAHIIRFKLSAKRSGIILIHLGVILLLVGEGFTSG